MRKTLLVSCSIALVLCTASPALARAAWKERIDRAIGGRPVGVAIREQGRVLYNRSATTSRIPASNEKLLMSMALMDRVGPRFRIETLTAAQRLDEGVVRGDLWLLGQGDPTISSERSYTKAVPVPVTKIRASRKTSAEADK